MEILAVIPARSGSKGIRHKNIRPFAGKPLIAHTIQTAQHSRHLTRLIVSTDDQRIAAVARRYGAEVPFLRPARYARDQSLVVEALVHLLETLARREQYQPEYLALLQPTSPLRTAADIDGALELLWAQRAEAVVSVCATEQMLFTKDARHGLHLVSSRKFLVSTNRQELAKTYKLDGSMVYAIKTTLFLKRRSFLTGKLIGYEIPRWRAVDLDEPQDFVVGEILFQQAQLIERRLAQFR